MVLNAANRMALNTASMVLRLDSTVVDAVDAVAPRGDFPTGPHCHMRNTHMMKTTLMTLTTLGARGIRKTIQLPPTATHRVGSMSEPEDRLSDAICRRHSCLPTVCALHTISV